MKRTIILVTNRQFKRGEVARLRDIAEANEAQLVTCNDKRVTHHTAWFTYPNIGLPFTRAAAELIRKQAEAAGIEL